jgi:hypothetical protein
MINALCSYVRAGCLEDAIDPYISPGLPIILVVPCKLFLPKRDIMEMLTFSYVALYIAADQQGRRLHGADASDLEHDRNHRY